MVNIYFCETTFQMNLLTSLSYFQTEPKKIYLQSKFKMFELKRTQNDFIYNMKGAPDGSTSGT